MSRLVVRGTARDCTWARGVLVWAGFMARHLPHHAIRAVDDLGGGDVVGLFCWRCLRGVAFHATGAWPPLHVLTIDAEGTP